MSTVRRRDYRLSGKLGAGGTWSTLKPAGVAWGVRPADVITVSAFAVRRTGYPVSLRVIGIESALVLAAVTHKRGAPMRWTSTYEKIHPHVKTFVVECVGLAVTIHHCRTMYKWTPRHDLHHIDALAAGMGTWGWLRPPTGPRPDFAYTVPAKSVAGAVVPPKLRAAEAKGRRADTPKGGASKKQIDRMVELINWSGYAATHAAASYVARKRHWAPGSGVAYSACWVWMGADPVMVDTFDPGKELALSEEGWAALRAETDAVIDSAIASTDDSTEAVTAVPAVAPSACAVLERISRPGAGAGWVVVIGASEDLADLGDSDEAIERARETFNTLSNGAVSLVDASFGRRLVGLVVETRSKSLSIRAVEGILAVLYGTGNKKS